MKEELIKLLGLKTDATDDAVIAAVQGLQRDATVNANAKGSEKEIRKLIAESHGALSWDAAKQVLADRALHDKNADKKAGKK